MAKAGFTRHAVTGRWVRTTELADSAWWDRDGAERGVEPIRVQVGNLRLAFPAGTAQGVIDAAVAKAGRVADDLRRPERRRRVGVDFGRGALAKALASGEARAAARASVAA